jgi:RNA polymerase sigma-70 factor, ECF subfamily
VGKLAEIYRAATGRDSTEGDEKALEQRLGELCQRGRDAHPSLGLADEIFVAHLARCEAPVIDVLSPLHAEDIYLACACLAGIPMAIAQLRADSRPVLARYLARIHGVKAIFEEVEQRLWDMVLVGSGDGPKLASYRGRGALGSWIGVSGQRIALMLLRHERIEARARHETAAQHGVVGDDPELGVIRENFRRQFEEALEAALSTLDDREKTLYRMHLVDGLPLVHIGNVYGVNHSTISRWLAAAREQVLDAAKSHLKASLSVSSGEFDSIARMLLSQLDLDISAILSKPT